MSRAARTCATPRIAYNSCRNRHCPKCQGAAAKEWLAEREAELLPVPYFHVVFTLPAPIADIAYQNKAVIYDLLFKASAETLTHDRGRPQAPRRPHRHHLRSAHLGLGAHPSSACPHDRAGRRHLARRRALGLLPARLLPAGARALAPVPPVVPGEAGRGPPGRPADSSSAIMLRSPTRRRSRPIWRRCADAEWVVYAKRPFGGPQARAGLSVALHPPRRHLQQPPDRARRAQASPSDGRTIASMVATARRS